jgi:hypothetical protein
VAYYFCRKGSVSGYMEKKKIGDYTEPMQCGHCRNKTIHMVIGTYFHKYSDDDTEFWILYYWELLKCMTCFKPILIQLSGTDRHLGSLDRKFLNEHFVSLLEDYGEFNRLYPAILEAPEASPDMPENVASDYNEARSILPYSPRSSAALLRLALQKLCKHLGKPGKNINDDIKALVKDGLSPRVQQALDAVRVIGNNAVHPGEIDLNDDYELALSLFDLMNFIVQETITRPRMISKIYNELPKDKLDQIKKRDS